MPRLPGWSARLARIVRPALVSDDGDGVLPGLLESPALHLQRVVGGDLARRRDPDGRLRVLPEMDGDVSRARRELLRLGGRAGLQHRDDRPPLAPRLDPSLDLRDPDVALHRLRVEVALEPLDLHPALSGADVERHPLGHEDGKVHAIASLFDSGDGGELRVGRALRPDGRLEAGLDLAECDRQRRQARLQPLDRRDDRHTVLVPAEPDVDVAVRVDEQEALPGSDRLDPLPGRLLPGLRGRRLLAGGGQEGGSRHRGEQTDHDRHESDHDAFRLHRGLSFPGRDAWLQHTTFLPACQSR